MYIILYSQLLPNIFNCVVTFRRYVTFACPDPWEGLAWFLQLWRIRKTSFQVLNNRAAIHKLTGEEKSTFYCLML